jgi:hypothetical protein
MRTTYWPQWLREQGTIQNPPTLSDLCVRPPKILGYMILRKEVKLRGTLEDARKVMPDPDMAGLQIVEVREVK